MTRLIKTLGRLAALPALEGYRTYLGAAAQALAGVGSLVTAAVSLRNHEYDLCESCVAFAIAGVGLLARALSDLGIGKKIDDLFETDAADDIDALAKLPTDVTGEYPVAKVIPYTAGDPQSHRDAIESAVLDGGGSYIQGSDGSLTYIPTKSPSAL